MLSPKPGPQLKPAAQISIFALAGVPRVMAGDDVAALVTNALGASDLTLLQGDVVVIAQKIVSKAEGRIVDLRTVTPTDAAKVLAAEVGKDARLVELILRESTEVVRRRKDVLIVAHRCGFVLANAGIDASNVTGDDQNVLLLPEDSDRSCRQIRAALKTLTGIAPGVLIIDSLGRAWRNGTIGTAIGAAGIPGLLDLRDTPDLFGRPLRTTVVGIADELAAAASVLMGQAAEGRPIVLMRGLDLPGKTGSATDLIRARELDLFR
jgi:coenzyme F420-0:L-glutamate ligase / coenzyme F420-1:gamma-L-glutamate ligase